MALARDAPLLHCCPTWRSGEQNQNWLPQPGLMRGPKLSGCATLPLHSEGSPRRGKKMRIGCLGHAFLGAQNWAEVLRHPCILRRPQQRGPKSEVAASATPSRRPKSGWKCYVTPAFSGVPNKGQRKENWLPKTCLLGGPKVGASPMSPLHSLGSPTEGNKIRSSCLSHAFSRAQKWAKVLRHPCSLEGPQERGSNSELAASTIPSRGPKSRRKCYATPAFSGVANKGEENQD